MPRLAEVATAPAPAALDETMMAMDVVDMLRHSDRLVARELDGPAKAEALKKRLREIYATQGIEVADHILDEGVAALEQQRFRYTPTPPGWQRSLATLWTTRARWGLAVGIGFGALVLGLGVFHVAVTVPRQNAAAAVASELGEGLPRALAAERDRVLAATQLAEPRATAERLLAEGLAAARAGNVADGRARLASLRDLQAALSTSYSIRIVNRPNEQSGVWRVPAANPRARNFYLIVEAVDSAGRPVEVPITSEEDGRTVRTSKWGMRVSSDVFEQVRKDKLADGVIDQPVIGEKRAGELTPRFIIPTQGGNILSW
ncbi:DUF6384 family protein [Humitalea sp. 24SJ18S-53]|uniref:DUF6384 family protein n=1 Tax=Humitalea sp. 24SJ18S-53 TaxID=3422307 RepID=UPI003D6714AA